MIGSSYKKKMIFVYVLGFLGVFIVDSMNIPDDEKVVISVTGEPDEDDVKMDPFIPDLDKDEGISPKLTDLVDDDHSGHSRHKRVIFNHPSLIWTDGLIPYEINPDVNDTALKQAMTLIEENTCIDFFDRQLETHMYSVTFEEYLQFQTGSGCWSYLGRYGPAQPILACNTLEVALHEELHAIGIFHEHSHKDRDDFIHVKYSNIIDAKESNYDKKDMWYVHSGTYSPHSVMHYSEYSWSENGYRTIVPLDDYFPTSHVNTWEAFKQVNVIYGCQGDCDLSCQHEGYPIYSTTSGCKCVCIEGLDSASLCSQFSQGTVGEMVDVTEAVTYLSLAQLSGGSVVPGTTYMWLIEGPVGSRLALDFSQLEVAKNGEECDSSLTIMRRHLSIADSTICGSGFARTIISDKNTITLMLESNSASDVLEAEVRLYPDGEWCYNLADRGATYNGEVNRAEDNSACLNWAETTQCDRVPFTSSSLPADYSGNACRNPGGVLARPWCYTNIDDAGCDIKYCDACSYGRVYDSYDDCDNLVGHDPEFCGTQDGMFGCRKTCGLPKITVTSASSCGAPEAIVGSSIVESAQTSYSIGSYVTYQCNDDASVTRERYCLSTGQWSVLNAVCGGELQDVSSDCTSLAADASFCGTTDGQTQCARTCHEEITCTVPTPTSSDNSELLTSGSVIPTGQTAVYRCMTGYVKMEGDEYRTCRRDGTLSGRSLSCVVGVQRSPATCDVTSPAASDHVTCSPTGTVDSGTSVLCFCESGYTPTSGHRERACYDGTLSGEQPVCEAISCDTTKGDNVLQQGSETTIASGSSVTYSCLDGYTLVSGNLERTCTDRGVLSGQHPVCAEQLCRVEIPSSDSNAVRLSHSTVTVASTAQYACLAGFILTSGNLERLCGVDGSLAGQSPQCTEIKCDVPLPSNDDMTSLVTPDLSIPVGVAAEYTCTSGQVIGGTLSRLCQSDGTLSGSAPRCSSSECTVPDLPNANVVRLSDESVSLNELAQYSCLPGYSLTSGELVRTCETNGVLSGNEPRCDTSEVCVDIRGDCAAVLGLYSLMCQTYPEFAGDCPATCGNCQHQDTTCEVGAPQSADNVNILQATAPLYPGDVVEYQCAVNKHLLSGHLVRACTLDGSLTGQSPKCSDRADVTAWLNTMVIGQLRFEQTNTGSRAIFGPSEYTTIQSQGVVKCWRFYCVEAGNIIFIVVRREGDYPNHSYTIAGHSPYVCHKDRVVTHCPDSQIPVQAGDIIGYVDLDGGNIFYKQCSSKSADNYAEIRVGSRPQQMVEGYTFSALAGNQFCLHYSLNALVGPAES